METPKAVAVIASSGGGTATLGHTDPIALLSCIHEELTLCQAFISHALYVCLDGGKSMDGVDERNARAALYEVNLNGPEEQFQCNVVIHGSLQQVNQVCKEKQRGMATAIKQNRLDGLISISSHSMLFKETFVAAAQNRIAVTGSGGSSLAQASSKYGVRIVGNAGGSVATTTYTRAVSYCAALAADWKRSYQPWLRYSNRQVPSVTSVLNSCLPAFWGVILLKSVIRFLAHNSMLLSHMDILLKMLESQALPTALSMVMSTTVTTLIPNTSLAISSALSCSVCSGSILAGLISGWLISITSERLLYWCIFHNIPATMTNMMTAGGVGMFSALLLGPISPFLRGLTFWTRYCIKMTVSTQSWQLRTINGLIWGSFSCYGAKVGWYHSIFLPLVLIEMEEGDASFLGAIDELTLVLVCAGICTANLAMSKMYPDSIRDTALSRRGLFVNLTCGDFIEVCYPYMEANRIINIGGYLASGVSCAVLVLNATDETTLPKSSAYVPWPLSLWLAGKQWKVMFAASMLSFGISFIATIIGHTFCHPKSKKI